MYDTDITKQLDALGDEGWELAGVHTKNPYGGTFYFKRPKKDQS
jgi:hypothetical protein